jgi:hypothetical protein
MKHTTAFCVLAIACACSTATAFARQPMGFDLDITLSAKAADRLRATREGITVSASYYGDAKKDAEKHADDVGHIDLGTELIRLPGQAGKTHVSGKNVKSERFDWMDGAAKVNVNVFSSRVANKDNILTCDFIDADVAQVVKSQPISLHCALIEEHTEAELKPKQP